MVVNVHTLYLFSHCVSFALLIIDFILILHVHLIRVLLKINQSIKSHARCFCLPLQLWHLLYRFRDKTIENCYFSDYLVHNCLEYFALFSWQRSQTRLDYNVQTVRIPHWSSFGNSTIRQIIYEFLLVFHCNYGHILYRFRKKARYWSKNATFYTPLYLTCTIPDPLAIEPLLIFAQILIQTVRVPIIRCKNIAEMFKSLRVVQQRQTDDRQTDRRRMP